MEVGSKKVILVGENTIKYLKLIMAMPIGAEKKRDKIYYFNNYAMMTIFCCYLPIGVVLHIIKNIRSGEYNYIDDDLNLFMSYWVAQYFDYRFSIGTVRLVNIHRDMSEFKYFGKPKKFDQEKKRLDRMSTIFFFYQFTMTSLISFSSVFLSGKCKENNEKEGIDEICGMIGRIWLPFDYDFFPVKQIIFAYELLASYLCYLNAGYSNYVFFEAIEHLRIRFDHLCEVFVEVLKIQDPVQRRKKFRELIQYHYFLLELGERMNGIFSPCCIFHLILTGPVLGISEYRLMTSVAPIGDISLFFSWGFCTVLTCTTGQRLQDSSVMLSDILYQTDWYELEKQLQRDVQLVIFRGRRAITLNAGPLGYMNFATLVLIGKTSYSYLTLLRQTM